MGQGPYKIFPFLPQLFFLLLQLFFRRGQIVNALRQNGELVFSFHGNGKIQLLLSELIDTANNGGYICESVALTEIKKGQEKPGRRQEGKDS